MEMPGVSAKGFITMNVLSRMSQGTSEPGVSWYRKSVQGLKEVL